MRKRRHMLYDPLRQRLVAAFMTADVDAFQATCRTLTDALEQDKQQRGLIRVGRFYYHPQQYAKLRTNKPPGRNFRRS